MNLVNQPLERVKLVKKASAKSLNKDLKQCILNMSQELMKFARIELQKSALSWSL
jgi:hypothetical protein